MGVVSLTPLPLITANGPGIDNYNNLIQAINQLGGYFSNAGVLGVPQGGSGNSVASGFIKAQKSAIAAANSNLVANGYASTPVATIVGSASTAPSTTGFTDLLGTTHGYVGNLACTSTLGSPVLTNVSGSVANLVVGQPIVEYAPSLAYPQNIPIGAVVKSFTSSPNTITMSVPATGSATIPYAYICNGNIDYIGGYPGDYSNGCTVIGGTTGNAQTPPTASRTGVIGYAIEFIFDGGNFTTAAPSLMLFLNNSAGGTPNSYRVAIDGQYQSSGPVAFGGTTSDYLTIQFASGGEHVVRIELAAGMLLQYLWVTTGCQIRKKTPPYVAKACFFGNSYFDLGGNTPWPARNMAMQCASLLGWRPYLISVGGTDFAAGFPADSSSSNYNFVQPARLNDLTRDTYDVIVTGFNINDQNSTVTTHPPSLVQANAYTWLVAARKAQPNAAIFMFGVARTPTFSDAVVQPIENAIAAAVTAFADPNVFFIPVSTAAGGDFITSGNVSTYYGADNTHPTDPAGTNFYATFMANSISQILQQNTTT